MTNTYYGSDAEFELEADIYDDPRFAASIAPVTEGTAAVLIVQGDPSLQFEYYVESVSANGTNPNRDYTDPNSTSSTSWATVGTGGTVSFPTDDDSLDEPRESFKIHVRPVGQSGHEVIIEADILDNDLPAVLKSAEYTYDAFDTRIAKSVDSDGPGSTAAVDTIFSWENNQIALQFEDGDLTHRYLYGPIVDQLFADETVTSTSTPGTVIWPLADHLGTLADLATHNSTNHTTAIANHRTFDSFGNITAETNSAIDLLFAFTGRERDDESGLQYNRARYYDPLVGLWISEDPIGFVAGDTNVSRYVGNSTTIHSDPSGLWVWELDVNLSAHNYVGVTVGFKCVFTGFKLPKVHPYVGGGIGIGTSASITTGPGSGDNTGFQLYGQAGVPFGELLVGPNSNIGVNLNPNNPGGSANVGVEAGANVSGDVIYIFK